MSSQSAPQAPASVHSAGGEPGFRPTAKQRAFLELIQNQHDAVSIRGLCGRGVVSTTTLYKWQKKPVFRQWLGQHSALAIHSNFALSWMLASQAAVHGDAKMLQLMLKYSVNPKGIAALSAYLAPGEPLELGDDDGELEAGSGERRAEAAAPEATAAQPDSGGGTGEAAAAWS